MTSNKAIHSAKFSRACKTLAAIAFTFSVIFVSVAPVLADGPAPDRKTARYEINFMQDMIDHHFMAVQVAQLCQQKAIHEELL